MAEKEQRSRWLPSPPEGTAHWLVQAIQRAFKFIYALQDQISSGLGITILERPHADRFLDTYQASKFAIGFLFIETDRDGVTYVDRSDPGSPGGQGWFWLSGDWHSVEADRPSDLGLRDTGYIFTGTDSGVTWRWDGTSWTWVSGVWRDTFANIPGRTGSANPVPGAGEAGLLFYATDTLVLFRWNGTKWNWLEGAENSTQANIRDIGGLTPSIWDLNGYLAKSTDFLHTYVWTQSVGKWRFNPGDCGSRWIVAVPGDGSISVPLGGNYHACDGGTATVATFDFTSGASSTISVTTPNLNVTSSEGVAIFGNATSTGVTSATSPTWDASHHITEDENGNHAHEVITTVEVQSGTGAFPAAAPGAFTGVENAVHQHELTNSNAKLNPPSEANGGLPKRISLYWWMRC